MKTVEQRIRIGEDNKPIILDGRELTNTTWDRSILGDIGSGCNAVAGKGPRNDIHNTS